MEKCPTADKYMEVYKILYDTSNKLCEKAFEEQHKEFFKSRKYDPTKSYANQGFQFNPPDEAIHIITDLMGKAMKGLYTKADAIRYRETVL